MREQGIAPDIFVHSGSVRGIIAASHELRRIRVPGATTMAHAAFSQLPDGVKPPAYFKEALEDAERLLKYAAEIGVYVEPDTRSAVLKARAAYHGVWTEEIAANLLLALTQLAAALKPVTAASLKAVQSETQPTMHTYLVVAILLSVVIIPASIATFVTSNISTEIRADIDKANALAVKLSAELGPPPRSEVGLTEKLADLQEYASTVRLIYDRSRRLNRYVFPHVGIPLPLQGPEGTTEGKPAIGPDQRAQYLKSKFELPVPLPLDNLAEPRDRMTETYQDVRYFAQTILTDISTFYGAITSCVLPILYALLGTCAYLLRTFEDQMGNRTFTPSAANSARFLIAAIGGTVIGLFGNFTSQASASPLAVAFLVGYAVEVFFAFLEGLIKAFTRNAPPPHPVQAPAAAGKSQ